MKRQRNELSAVFVMSDLPNGNKNTDASQRV